MVATICPMPAAERHWTTELAAPHRLKAAMTTAGITTRIGFIELRRQCGKRAPVTYSRMDIPPIWTDLREHGAACLAPQLRSRRAAIPRVPAADVAADARASGHPTRRRPRNSLS